MCPPCQGGDHAQCLNHRVCVSDRRCWCPTCLNLWHLFLGNLAPTGHHPEIMKGTPMNRDHDTSPMQDRMRQHLLDTPDATFSLAAGATSADVTLTTRDHGPVILTEADEPASIRSDPAHRHQLNSLLASHTPAPSHDATNLPWLIRLEGDVDDVAEAFGDLGRMSTAYQSITGTGWRLYDGRDLEEYPATIADLHEWIRLCLGLPTTDRSLTVTPVGPDEVVVEVPCATDRIDPWSHCLVHHTGPGSLTLLLNDHHRQGHPDATPVRACRVCGCTDDDACPRGCHWVPDPHNLGDICSACRPGAIEYPHRVDDSQQQ